MFVYRSNMSQSDDICGMFMEQQLFTVKEVCGIFSYGRTAIYAMIAKGELVTNGRRGRGLRIPRWSIEAYVERAKTCQDSVAVAPSPTKPPGGKLKAKAQSRGKTSAVFGTTASSSTENDTKQWTVKPTGRLMRLKKSKS